MNRSRRCYENADADEEADAWRPLNPVDSTASDGTPLVLLSEKNWADIMSRHGDDEDGDDEWLREVRSRSRRSCRRRRHVGVSQLSPGAIVQPRPGRQIAGRQVRWAVVLLLLATVAVAGFVVRLRWSSGGKGGGGGKEDLSVPIDDQDWVVMCSDESVSTVLGMEECSKRCSDWEECCGVADWEEGEGCEGVGNKQWNLAATCTMYLSLCPKLSAELDEWRQSCSDDSLQTSAGYDVCVRTCKDHVCCMDDDLGCDMVHSEACDSYWEYCPQLAEALIDVSLEEVLLDPEDEVEGEELGVVFEDIALSCSNMHNDTGSLNSCRKFCNDRMCCFGSTEYWESCSDDPSMECDLYSPCKVFLP